MAVIGLRQLLQKKYRFLENLPQAIEASFGKLTQNFWAIAWGKSGNGKSNLLMQLVRIFLQYGNVLYVSLEEGHEVTMQLTSLRHLNEESTRGKILFADHEEDFTKISERLDRKKSPRFVVIDSVQYLNITYDQYQEWKRKYAKTKCFLFISHCNGSEPLGSIANKIRYDVPVKVFVKGYIAFVISRYGGNKPYLIWEEGARKFWGKKLKKMLE